MNKNYLQMQSETEGEFKSASALSKIDGNVVETPPEDMRKIENILDLTRGILGDGGFYCSEQHCECGRQLSWYDVVFTSLVEQWHEPSFLVHCFVGRKYLLGRPGAIRCSNCGIKNSVNRAQTTWYQTKNYGCCYDIPKAPN